MQVKEYLQNYQPVIYKTFLNAINSNKLSHAYLLSGSNGMPLKEVAMYLGKTLVCDNKNPLACDNCITCLRINENNYPDFMVVDGEQGKIKKADVEKIINNFDKCALEDKGIMIYVLHLVESMTPATVNSLLKFLEEPGKNIYAFLTTENEAKVLPTIISRTQVLRFKQIDRQTIINEANKLGVSFEDAEILSPFYNDAETLLEISSSETYKIVKQALEDQLHALLISNDDAVFTCEKLVIPKIKTIETAQLYLKLLSEIFKNLLNLSVNEDITLKSYDTILHELLKHLSHIEKSLIAIMNANSKLNLNVNIPLLLDHIVYVITKEEK